VKEWQKRIRKKALRTAALANGTAAGASGSPTDATETAAATLANAGGVENRCHEAGSRSQKVGCRCFRKMAEDGGSSRRSSGAPHEVSPICKRTSKFMAHDELGATMATRCELLKPGHVCEKRWRVIEIVQRQRNKNCRLPISDWRLEDGRPRSEMSANIRRQWHSAMAIGNKS